MERLCLTVFGVLVAAVVGAVLGDRLEAVRESDHELMSVFGTVGMWAIAGIVILPNLGNREGRTVAVCMGLLLVVPEVLSRVTEGRGTRGIVQRGRSLCIAAVLVLHHFPEGMAAGLSCMTDGVGAAAFGWAVVLHSVPETMMLMPAMYEAGFGRRGGYAAAATSGIITAAGVLIGGMI